MTAPYQMPYAGRDVPHAVIEVNQKCNISCFACYKDKSTYTKPLVQVVDELDAALALRRLGVVTLAGGEPTLHPELPAIIRAAAARGLVVQLLSNGLNLTPARLRSYREAGLSRVYLHIDVAQTRPDAPAAQHEAELDGLRERLAERVVAAGLRCAITVTLYRRKNLDDLAGVVRFVLDSPHVDRLLVTCCTDHRGIAAALAGAGGAREPLDDLAPEVVHNADVERILAPLGLEPFAYVASSHDDDARRWLFYYAYTVQTPRGRARLVRVGPRFGAVAGAAAALARRLRGRYPFGEPLGHAGNLAMCLLWAAASRDRRAVGEVLHALAGLVRHGAVLTQKSLVFQQGPNLTADGEVEMCKDCPDATIRDGRLVPLCLADLAPPATRAACG
jgi:pyruvate-formate lyase-activating enzyme